MHITDLKGTVTLNNGLAMPYFGLGVFRMWDALETMEAVTFSLSAGYRHIDTASIYENEEAVGRAVFLSGINREEIFVTTKVWNSDQGYDRTLTAFESSLYRMGLDYLDLYLVHWPVKEKYNDTWRALETLYNEGRVKAIGVSNFLRHHLDDLLQSAHVVPAVNQMECHPWLVQQELIDYCHTLNIRYEAWSPLIKGKVFEIDIIRDIATKYGKDAAQVTLRWNLQKGIVTIPKSSKPERIKSNANIFDFELNPEEIKAIDSLHCDIRIGAHPDTFDF